MKHFTIIMAIMAMVGCNSNEQPLYTVDQLDIERYEGFWYEIAKLPNRFEAGLTDVVAYYQTIGEDKIEVINAGYNLKKGKMEQSEGIAIIDEPGKLRVSFFRPFYGDYYIMKVDQCAEGEYQWALVGSPDRKYLWLLSRTQEMEEGVFNHLVEYAAEEGFDVSNLEMTIHRKN